MGRDGWEQMGDFQRRTYNSYEEYVKIQASKLGSKPDKMAKISRDTGGTLKKMLTQLPVPDPPASVICLGARSGGEVQAFIESGYFAAGIDLNPGFENHYVVHGDFHALQFSDASIQIAYTNSLDHAYDLMKVIEEIKRVLIPGGTVIIESKGGTAEPGIKPAKSDFYDCVEWPSHQTLVDTITGKGFELIHEYRTKGFTPWGRVYIKL